MMGIFMYGGSSQWTFRWEEDLPRYQIAKMRWHLLPGKPAYATEGNWWIKQQEEILRQSLANCTVLALPVAVSVIRFDHGNLAYASQLVGVCIWAASWLFENRADMQKMAFVAKCKALLAEPGLSDSLRSKVKSAVLGESLVIDESSGQVLLDARCDPAYSLWQLCRHPNYFGEWGCWIGFSVAAVPSALELSMMPVGLPLHKSLTILFVLCVLLPWFFYVCLVHWTGAAPAEHFSLRRPEYSAYQKRVRCFYPFELCGIDHYRKEGWPQLLQPSDIR